jgi:hypothetical protein
MILYSIFSLMLISSVTVIVYVNYFTALTEKQNQKSAFKNKMRGKLGGIKNAEIEKQALLEDVA